jgi:hypothetical protein
MRAESSQSWTAKVKQDAASGRKFAELFVTCSECGWQKIKPLILHAESRVGAHWLRDWLKTLHAPYYGPSFLFWTGIKIGMWPIVVRPFLDQL